MPSAPPKPTVSSLKRSTKEVPRQICFIAIAIACSPMQSQPSFIIATAHDRRRRRRHRIGIVSSSAVEVLSRYLEVHFAFEGKILRRLLESESRDKPSVIVCVEPSISTYSSLFTTHHLLF
jgi:hypothetical protein